MGAYTRKDKNEIAQRALEMVYKRFPRLKERQGQRSGTLSDRRRRAADAGYGRALMNKPRIILMDEPSMGLSPIFVNEIFDIIKEVSESGTTVLLRTECKKLFHCRQSLCTGNRKYYSGRKGGDDLLPLNEAVWRLIWENKNSFKLKEGMLLQGGTRMDEHI